jgi:hypothetical protein
MCVGPTGTIISIDVPLKMFELSEQFSEMLHSHYAIAMKFYQMAVNCGAENMFCQ